MLSTCSWLQLLLPCSSMAKLIALMASFKFWFLLKIVPMGIVSLPPVETPTDDKSPNRRNMVVSAGCSMASKGPGSVNHSGSVTSYQEVLHPPRECYIHPGLKASNNSCFSRNLLRCVASTLASRLRATGPSPSDSCSLQSLFAKLKSNQDNWRLQKMFRQVTSCSFSSST